MRNSAQDVSGERTAKSNSPSASFSQSPPLCESFSLSPIFALFLSIPLSPSLSPSFAHSQLIFSPPFFCFLSVLHSPHLVFFSTRISFTLSPSFSQFLSLSLLVSLCLSLFLYPPFLPPTHTYTCTTHTHTKMRVDLTVRLLSRNNLNGHSLTYMCT